MEDLTAGVIVMTSSLNGKTDALKLEGKDMKVLCGHLLYCLTRIEWFYP